MSNVRFDSRKGIPTLLIFELKRDISKLKFCLNLVRINHRIAYICHIVDLNIGIKLKEDSNMKGSK